MIYLKAPTKEEFEAYGIEDLMYASKINESTDFIRVNNVFGDLISTFNSFEVAEVRARMYDYKVVWAH